MTDKKKRKTPSPAEPSAPAPGAEGGSPADGQLFETDMMAISIADFTQLQADLLKANAQSQERAEGWSRERADFQNYRRMVERDQAQSALNLKGEIIKKYLPIVDDLELALKSRPQEGEAAAWANGIELIYRKLQTILENEGVQTIASSGQPFDPNIHQAITHEASPDYDSETIIEVVRQGYMVGERVLRPALVRVAN